MSGILLQRIFVAGSFSLLCIDLVQIVYLNASWSKISGQVIVRFVIFTTFADPLIFKYLIVLFT